MLSTFQHQTEKAMRLILVVSPINMSKHNIRLPPALLVHWCRRKGGESGSLRIEMSVEAKAEASTLYMY